MFPMWKWSLPCQRAARQFRTLADLVKPGIRVAIGQPDQCTIGALSRRMLESEDLYQKLKEKQKADGEIVVEKMSSALLVPDVIAGHVDAALVYITDVLPNADDIDIIRVTTTTESGRPAVQYCQNQRP